ncbi:MAG: efflux transporter outer membrane subunit [Sulfuricurvum sp.]|jgi:multidrug efflux system outer membrane protein|uniref:efflux transporter outer membrane subunit n=1 Tax=Sulfuricurvum sp. TaxID=2025608 RepID=UPI0025FC0C57|nr:efflux transporter outer membrane subunit [Sulfuricurvum sp.]MCK9373736.1 efflux transporter outer membrane subunit [Sulfuricurvum sp.]
MNSSISYGSLILALLLGGCAIGPDYKRPEVATPDTFRHMESNQSTVKTVDPQWWRAFNDPQLSATVEHALINNYDLLAAQTSVDAMLGKFDQAKSYLYPQINANSSLTRKGVQNATTGGYQLREGVTSTYAASLSLASYEIDLFGKVRRANEAARALLLTTEYARQTLQIAIASSAAVSYIKLASLNGQIALAKENLNASRDIEQQSALKYRHGVITESIYLQAQSEYEGAKATLSQLEAAKIGEEATLNLILGENPQAIKTTDLSAIRIPKIPEALPSSILANRPDIAVAEQNLIAANAQIGIARAAYYPSIRLTGMLGVQSLELSNFVTNPAQLWEIAPAITLPIFSAGRIEGEIKTAEADHNKTLLQYQKAIIGAFNDADNAIGQNAKAKEQLHYQLKRTEAIQKAYEQSRLRYKVGTISYGDLLLVQQQWLQASQQNILAQQNTLIATVSLYKALGGGWDKSSHLPEQNLLPAGR